MKPVEHKSISIPGIIPGYIHVFVADTVFDGVIAMEKMWNMSDDISREEKRKPSNAMYTTVRDSDGSHSLNIILTPVLSLGTIAHEVLHISWELLDHFDIKVDVCNQEPLARSIQFVLDAVLDAFPKLLRNHA